jgi:hypothetical protein
MINVFKSWFENSWWQWGNSIYFRIDRYEDNIDRCAFFYEINRGWYDMYDPDDDWEAFKCYEKQSGL